MMETAKAKSLSKRTSNKFTFKKLLDKFKIKTWWLLLRQRCCNRLVVYGTYFGRNCTIKMNQKEAGEH